MSSLTQFEYLLERYWELAYMEGKEGRTHDDEAGNAARVLSELRALFPAAIELSPAPVQPQAEPVAPDFIAAYEDAIDDIENWAAYASEYFQTKWGLAAVLKAHRDRLAAMKGTP